MRRLMTFPILWLTLSLLACGTKYQYGTYTATFSGFHSGMVSGVATSQKNSGFDETGIPYLIDLALPDSLAGPQKYRMIFGSKVPFATGEYRATESGGNPATLDVAFIGADDPAWTPLDGTLKVQGVPPMKTTGTFRLRFTHRGETTIDTMAVDGIFQIP